MVNTRSSKTRLNSYTIPGTNKVIKAGDSIMLKASEPNKPPYLARVEGFEAIGEDNINVKIIWYYRPEDTIEGRREFYGAKEVFLSDHWDSQNVKTIEGTCNVHSFKNYRKLETINPEDYYFRYRYYPTTGGFKPNAVRVLCKCEMPYNPDKHMIQCDGCKDWYHFSCLDMTAETAQEIDHYFCSDCSSVADNTKSSPNTVSPVPPAKVETKRRKR